MDDVTRYAWTYDSDDDTHYLEPDEAGDWVRHDDYAALRARLADLETRLGEVTEERNVQTDLRQIAEDVADELRARLEAVEAALATARRDAVKIKSDAINDFCAKAGIAMSVEVKAIPEDVREFRRESAFRALKDTLPQPRDTTQEVKP